MKCWWEFISRDGEEREVIRRRYDLPSVSAEDFDPKIHTGKIFMYPESNNGGSPTHGIYIWKVAIPENKEEEEKLISFGKWNTKIK
jgi:hypothetical protein